MIGVLGGTFDPIHNGHLHIAKRVAERLNLEQLQFMPCALPVHRDKPHAQAEHRCAMIELAIADKPGFRLNRLELEREGPSYSVDSLRQLRQTIDAPIALVLGADAFNGFGGWKQPREILRLAHLVVCVRPGYQLDRELFGEHRVDSIDELFQRSAGGILMLEVDAPDCSSSDLRQNLADGISPCDCLHPAVADYIHSHHLYRRTGDRTETDRVAG